VLLGGDRCRRDAAVVLAGGVDREATPTRADLQQMVFGAKAQALADARQLCQLRFLEARSPRREVGARIDHPLVEEGGEEVVAEVVVGGDVLLRSRPRVLRDQLATPLQQPALAGGGAAQAIELAQLAGDDADQRDQVVGLPESSDVGLAKPDAAAQRAAPGGGIADCHRRLQVGTGGAEGAPLPTLDHVDLASAEPRQCLLDDGAGEPVL
jgi:hypothetical protein